MRRHGLGSELLILGADEPQRAETCFSGSPLFLMRIAVVAIIKDGARYVPEWVAHHLELGVEKFYVFDDNSSDNLRVICNQLHGVQWHPATKTRERETLQLDVYNEALAIARNEGFDWILPLDIDEFVRLKQHATFQEMFAEHFHGASQVCMNWRIFGSNDEKFDDPTRLVLDRFTGSSYPEFYRNKICKSLAKVSDVVYLHMHIHKVTGFSLNGSGGGANQTMRDEIDGFYGKYVEVNHYCIRSVQEFLEKQRRGYPEHAWHLNVPIPNGYFEKNDRNDVHFKFPQHVIQKIKDKIKLWLSISYP